MRPARSTLAASIAVLALLAPGTAHADEKEACFTAQESGQADRQQGRLVSARQQFSRCTRPVCPSMIQKDCAERIAELDRVMPSLLVEVRDPGGGDVASYNLKRDGVAVPPATAARPLPVDPGKHTAVIESPGMQPVTRDLLVREGERGRRERIVMTRAGSLAGGHDALAEAGKGRSQRLIGFGLGGLGLAGLGASGVLALRPRSLVDDSNAHCNPSNQCTQQGLDIRADASKAQTASLVLLGVGAAALGAGIVLWATAPSPAARGAGGATWQLAIGGGPGTLHATGMW